MVSHTLRPSATILVVDDLKPVRELLCDVLQTAGYTVLVATTGSEALEASQRHGGKIDLLLIDLEMPDMNGLDLTKELMSIHHRMRVLYMFEAGEQCLIRRSGDEVRGLFMSKPFTQDTIHRQVGEALE